MKTLQTAAAFLHLIFTLTQVKAFVSSGIYIDNGFDQTTIERVMTKSERREVQREILHLLGLPDRPKEKLNLSLNKSAPRFLLDVYNSLLDPKNKQIDDLDLTSGDKRAIDESDLIVTFEVEGGQMKKFRHKIGSSLYFKTKNVQADEVIGANLRIYKTGKNLFSNRTSGVYSVKVYRIVQDAKGQRRLKFESSTCTSSDYTGWLEINVTRSFIRWIKKPNENKGLYVSVGEKSKLNDVGIKPKSIGLVTEFPSENQPFLVGFLKSPQKVQMKRRKHISPILKREKRSSYSSMMTKKKHDFFMEASEGQSTCRIHTLYINFRDLQWHDWIIAPDGYAAYFCAGDCNFPLNSHMNSTNHAIVQSLVHLMNPARYPKPCCTPTKLNPISVLYSMNDNNISLKKYKRMVVKSCGCL